MSLVSLRSFKRGLSHIKTGIQDKAIGSQKSMISSFTVIRTYLITSNQFRKVYAPIKQAAITRKGMKIERNLTKL